MNDVERFVWSRLRARRFHEFKFRRQVSMGPYVVDFVCFEKSLIIELDGGHHNSAEQRAHDETRSAFLQKLGFRVLRFWNSQIAEEWDAVEEAIWNALHA